MSIDHDLSQNQRRHTRGHRKRTEPILQAATTVLMCQVPCQCHPLLPSIGRWERCGSVQCQSRRISVIKWLDSTKACRRSLILPCLFCLILDTSLRLFQERIVKHPTLLFMHTNAVRNWVLHHPRSWRLPSERAVSRSNRLWQSATRLPLWYNECSMYSIVALEEASKRGDVSGRCLWRVLCNSMLISSFPQAQRLHEIMWQKQDEFLFLWTTCSKQNTKII